MKLADLSVTEFTRVLASQAPAPGGGSTSALSAALGTALTAMVCALTQGKKKYLEFEEHAKAVQAQTEELWQELLVVMDRDTEAFNMVSAVFAMPKATEEEKAARKAAMDRALKASTETPLQMMLLADRALSLTEQMLDRFNRSAASDLGCAALSLKAGIQGAWLNVLINTQGMEDADFAQDARRQGRALLARALPTADRVYTTLEEELDPC